MSDEDQNDDVAKNVLGAQIRRLNAEKRSGGDPSTQSSMGERTASGDASARCKSSSPSLGIRFRAWWGGYDAHDYNSWLQANKRPK